MRGPKKGKEITGIYMHRENVEMLLLEMFYDGDLGISPQEGLATLERFIADKKIFVGKSGKPLSFNTIKSDFTDIFNDFIHGKSNRNKNK